MKEDKSMVSAAPHWLDNKQTPLLINFSPFLHVSPHQHWQTWSWTTPGLSSVLAGGKSCGFAREPGTLCHVWHPLLPAQTGVRTRMAQWSPIQAHWGLEGAWDT